MTVGLNYESAQIYQFPAGGRSALGARRYEASKTATDLASSRVNEVVASGAWYHEAAIQEAKSVRER